MRHAVSVSLGSPSRDFSFQARIAGEEIWLERLGTGGDLAAARALLSGLDGRVDALGLGGVNLYLRAGARRFPMPDGMALAAAVRRTPLCDGGILKDWWEPEIPRFVADLAGVRWDQRSVLVSSVLDRWALTESLVALGSRILVGDPYLALRLPEPLAYPISRLGPARFGKLAAVTVPLLARLPLSWLYPLGAEQEREPRRHPDQGNGPLDSKGITPRLFREADTLVGDFHLLKRRIPDDLGGKIVLTGTLHKEDRELLRRRGVSLLVTSFPCWDGRAPGNNLMEAALVALGIIDRDARGPEVARKIREAGLEPEISLLSSGRVTIDPNAQGG